MKKVQTNSRNFLVVAALVLATGTTIPSFASSGKNKEVKETPVAVKYLGSVNEEPVLQIQFTNQTEGEVTVTLRNDDGSYLYSEKFSGKEFNKKFRFERVDLNADDMKLQLQITSKGKNESQVFQINKTTRLVDDVAINAVQ